jgi:Domain of unknown function (DUF6438)
MKSKLLNIILLSVLLQGCKSQPTRIKTANYIDSIQTATQIESLISKVESRYRGFKVNDSLKFASPDCQKYSDELKINAWQKADFDQNGLTDLLVVGTPILCVLDKGNQKYEINALTRSFFPDCTFPSVRLTNQLSLIDYHYHTRDDEHRETSIFKKKSLIYKYGDFIEFNEQVTAHKIEKIEYSTSPCFGTCPVFKLALNADKSATWNAEMYNKMKEKEFKGAFKATLADTEYQEIIDLLNYLDFEKLKDSYAVEWTDDQTAYLKITYDNGKIKSIRDYGLIGTFGLGRVHQWMFKLREIQKWVKI